MNTLVLIKPQVIGHLVIKHSFFIALCLLSTPIMAFDTGTVDVGTITGEGWKLVGLKIAVLDLNQKKPQFRLSATKITLDEPFHDLSLTDIRCNDFSWNKTEVHCHQGRASVRSAFWQSPKTDFSFHLGPKKITIQFENAQLMGSRLSVNAEMSGDNWLSTFTVNHISHFFVEKLFEVMQVKLPALLITQGHLNLNGAISGKQATLGQFVLNAEVESLTGQMGEGKIAAEKLSLLSHWEGKKSKDNWLWQSDTKMTSGALYADPVYVEALQPIYLKAQGVWNTHLKKVEIQSFTYQDFGIASMSGTAVGYLDKVIKLEKGDVDVQSNSLQGLLTTYINPFLSDSPLTGITATGELQACFSFVQQGLINASVNFRKLNLSDEAGRLAIKEGLGSLNWSEDPLRSKQSELAWKELSIKGLLLESSRVKLSSQGNQVMLAEKIKLPFYEGLITVDTFSWQSKKQDEPDVSFTGSMEKVSLEQLSKALGWTPLLGNVSGQIPSVHYHDKILSMDGELLIHVFDGAIKVNNLSSSGLLTNFPNVSADVTVENLDLDQLTRKFEFGNITGRLSGYVNKLVLENWHPVTFFAWLGSPDDDDSSHRISQKAVNNIASIGGGGATDLLSRTFLGFFETFGYDKMGVGCYLQNGVCQMMGLAAKEQGYYLIKGGGLPRIDVLGYNTRVNWDVLVERLSRVTSPDKVIVQ